MEIRIGQKVISKNGAPFIIAEAGVNHNGSIDIAKKMISTAKSCGADAIKFQTFKANELIVDKAITYTYKSQGKEVTESMHEMFLRYEFTREEWIEIKSECKKNDIIFFSTPQNKSDLDLLLDIGIELIKIGSDDFTNTHLLKEYRDTGLPIIASFGMSDLNEVEKSLGILGYENSYPVILLLCTSEYPTPPEHANLLKLKTILNKFPNLIIGFSDHTLGAVAAATATGLGAVVFEKHFTLDNNLPGPDHWFSENPESLKVWIDTIKEAYKTLGSGIVAPTEKELEMRKLARRSIVAIEDIDKDEIFTNQNIGMRRPGTGLPSEYLDLFLGNKSKRKIKANSILNKEDIK